MGGKVKDKNQIIYKEKSYRLRYMTQEEQQAAE